MSTKTATDQASTFQKVLAFCLKWEGEGIEDVPGDPGGITNSGVTHEDYDNYRREHGMHARPVRLMTPDEELAIYREHYWQPIHGDDLPINVAWCLFDASVNVGTGRAVVWLQKILGVTADGAFGPMTLAAAQTYIRVHGQRALTDALLTRRQAYYDDIGAQGKPLHKFWKGWSARVADLRKAIGG